MDRGVKIAIFVACIAALSLGLIWDQVLSSTRNVIVKDKPAHDSMSAEEMRAFVGLPSSQRVESQAKQDGSATAEQKPAVDPNPPTEIPKDGPQLSPDDGWIEYRAKPNDGWWTIAHEAFKGRGLTSTDIANANPGVKVVKEGQILKIPPAKRK